MIIGISLTFLARVAIVLIMFGFWAVLFFYGDNLMRFQLSRDLKTGTIYRLIAGASILGVGYLQGWLYNASKPSAGPGDDFLRFVYFLEGVVGFLLVIRSAFRARRKGQR